MCVSGTTYEVSCGVMFVLLCISVYVLCDEVLGIVYRLIVCTIHYEVLSVVCIGVIACSHY